MARRKDGVDEKYRDRYRRWAGRTYKGKHPRITADTGVLPIMSYDQLNTDKL